MKYLKVIAISLLMVSCKTVNIYVLSAGDAEVLVEQHGSDVDSKLKGALK